MFVYQRVSLQIEARFDLRHSFLGPSCFQPTSNQFLVARYTSPKSGTSSNPLELFRISAEMNRSGFMAYLAGSRLKEKALHLFKLNLYTIGDYI